MMLSSFVLGPGHLKPSSEGKRTPVLFCHGTADPVIPFFAAQMSKQQMTDVYGCEVRFHEHAGGHTAPEEVMALVRAFLAERLPPCELGDAEREEAARAAVSGALSPPGMAPFFAAGAEVTVRGLKSAPEHNGTVGTVLGLNAANGRVNVQLPAAEKPLGLRPQCLTQVLGGVTLLGEVATEVTLYDYDEEAQAFRVRRAGGEGELARPEDIRLPNRTTIRVDGLQSEKGKAFNDRLARIVGFDEAEGRYVVDFGGNELLKVRPGNALP